jgi:uncharacterized protein YfdQ (DUF2303 family)
VNVSETEGLKILFEKAKELQDVQLVVVAGAGREDDGTPECMLASVPRGRELLSVKKYLDEYLEAPERRKGTTEVTTIDSFVDHVKRFADEDSAIFANDDPKSPALLAVLDYHRAGAVAAPRFGKHRTSYQFPVSEEWAAWMAPRDSLDQASFAAFLEDRIGDVMDPSSVGEGTRADAEKLGINLVGPAKLLELARGLSVRVDSQVAQHVNLSTGETSLAFDEAHKDKAGKPLKVPNGFVVAIPIFRGGALYQIPVRLRYRVRSGSITFSTALHRPEESFRDAFAEACAKAAEATGLPLFYGKPEA